MEPPNSRHLQQHHHQPAPIDALAAAAAAAEPGSDSAAPGAGEGKAAGGGWEFPVFVGHRRQRAPDDELFETGNIEREQLARQVGSASAAMHAPALHLSSRVRPCLGESPMGAGAAPDARRFPNRHSPAAPRHRRAPCASRPCLGPAPSLGCDAGTLKPPRPGPALQARPSAPCLALRSMPGPPPPCPPHARRQRCRRRATSACC